MQLHAHGVTEGKLLQLCLDHGVCISVGQINHLLLTEAASAQSEPRAAHRASMEHSPYTGIDGTFTPCDGEPMGCHTLGNEVFSTSTTTTHGDRVSVVGTLAGMQSSFGTLREINVNPSVFLEGRITRRGSVPRLDALVRDAGQRRFRHAVATGEL